MFKQKNDAEVWILEHEDEFATTLREMLEAYGWSSRRLVSYDAVLDRLQQQTPASLICDLSPIPSARRFLSELSQRAERPTRVAFLAIYSDPTLWPELSQYPGEFTFLAKPFRASTLFAALFPPLML